jgi:hypothetical protein
MSSYAHVKIDGMEIFSTQNYYYEWYFRKSERLIESMAAVTYYDDPEQPNDEIIKIYQYKISAASLRRRLNLAGFNRQSLENEFKTQRDQQIKDAEEMIEIDPEGDAARFLPILRSSNLDDWLDCLRIIHTRKLEVNFWGNKQEKYENELLTFMLLPDGFYTNHPTAGSYSFPYLSLEGFAVAVLEIVPETAECILDVTNLVDSGWTDAFNDLEEYQQEFTTFYHIFSASITDVKSLNALAPENITLVRMLYANVITAMETYLSDTLKKQVLSREAIKRRFVRSHDFFKDRKFAISTIFEKLADLKEEIITEIDRMSFHNLDKIPGLYRSVLDTEFPTHLLPELRKAINRRHDIVHRNGKSTDGHSIELTICDVEKLITLVDETVVYIDRQVKDGLLEEVDMKPLET